MRTLLSICLLAASLAILPSALAQDVLRILAWPGYADPDIVAEFGRRFKVRVEVSYVVSDAALFEKIRSDNGADFDVFAVNTAELQRYIDLGLSVPIDLGRIRNHANQSARFRNLSAIPALSRNGKIYAIPYTFSEMGLIYNRKIVKTPQLSMAALWDPRYRGRVLAYDGSSHNFTIAALLMGVKNPFRLNERDLSQATKRLVDLRRNVLTFYGSPEEATKLFRENEIAYMFGNYGMQQVKELRAAGADVGYVVPQEGALAWLDCWVVSAGRKGQELAESWINYTLEKNVSQTLTARQGLANTITQQSASAGNERIIWLEAVEDVARRQSLWDRIVSGDGFDDY